MKLNITLRNTRGGKKSTCDDSRILVDVSYKNRMLGTLGLYAINDWPSGDELGFRVVWTSDDTPSEGSILKEEERQTLNA